MERKTKSEFPETTEQIIYPLPLETLDVALNELEADGSVMDFDDETNEPFIWEPCKPVPLDILPNDAWSEHLIQVARSIAGLCSDLAIASRVHARPAEKYQAKRSLKNTAHHLSAYRHDYDFMTKAVSLVKIHEAGFLIEPNLPVRIWGYSNEIQDFRGYVAGL